MIIPGTTPPDILAAMSQMRVDLSPLSQLAQQYVKNKQSEAFFADPANTSGVPAGLVGLARAQQNPALLAQFMEQMPRLELLRAANAREEAMAPLSRAATAAGTTATLGGERRADSTHLWDIASRYKALTAPSDLDATLGAMGVEVPPRAAPLIPPLPRGLTPGGVPPAPAARLPVAAHSTTPAAMRPAIAPTLAPEAASETPPRFDAARPPSGYAMPTGVPGSYAAFGPSASVTPASVAPPPPGRADAPWSGRTGAAMGLMATGRITPEAARGLIRGPAFAGMPDAVHTEHFKMVHAANDAAAAAEGMVGSIDQLKALAPQAFIGANAETRTALAAQLASFGVSHEWLIKNQSLPATQLIQQGLSQFIGAEAAKYKPISNSDITFIRSTLPNVSQDPTAMMNALEAMRKTALRQQLYETTRAQMMQTNPYPDLASLRMRIKELVPDHVFDPTLGKPPPATPGTAGGTPGPAGASGGPSLGPGRYSWSPDGGVAPITAPTAPARVPDEPSIPSWSRYR